MAQVARDMLKSDLVSRSTNPVSSVFTPISVNVLIWFVRRSSLLGLVESHGISGTHRVVSSG